MQALIQEIKNHLLEELNLTPDARILVACSGGRDSVFLCYALHQAGFAIGLAHCNYQLRGEASGGDEQLVEGLASQLELPYFVERFDTKALVKTQKGSLQEVARKLRYTWLEQTRHAEGFGWIATGHHLEDNMETVLLNLTKGTGLKGLTGIPAKRDHIIRPLLHLSRSQISAFLETNQIAWRDDASNQETHYHRNKIRHQVLPVLKSMNPGLEATLLSNLENFKESLWIVQTALNGYKEQFQRQDKHRIYIDWINLKKVPARKTILHHLIAPYGFHPKQLDQIWTLIDQQKHLSGKSFFSKTYELQIDRDKFILQKQRKKQEHKAFHLPRKTAVYHLPEGQLHLELTESPATIEKRPHMAFLDAEKLSQQLVWRKWTKGDRFQPLGLSAGRQKVSDFLINSKQSQEDKANTYVLVSNEQIAWLAPHRIAEPFKIGPATKSVLKVEWKRITPLLPKPEL
ncbi:MAG: tRNA lysidine(34) synthetase TilS [Bacteroidota bacterium]